MQTKYQEIKQKLSEHGLTILQSELEFKGTNNISTLQCSKRHTWEAKISNVLDPKRICRPSKGCAECAKINADAKSIALGLEKLNSNYKILSSYIKQGNTSQYNARVFKIQCNHGHIYEKMNTYVADTCPKCNETTYVGQERTCLIFEKEFHQKFPKVRPDWLKNPATGNNLELDGYCEDLKLGFEYQGRQHSSNTTQFSGDLDKQLVRDNLKKELCEKAGVTLVQIMQPRFYTSKRFFDSVIKDCEVQGLKMKLSFNDVDFSIINEQASLKKNFEQFKSFVEDKNYKLHSKSLSTMQDNLDFECEVGHRFSMKGEEFKYNYKRFTYEKEPCAICNKEKNAKHVHSVLTIDSCKELAKKHDYEVISTSYSTINEMMQWKCNHGHTINKSFRMMLRNKTGQFCLECKEQGLYKKQAQLELETSCN